MDEMKDKLLSLKSIFVNTAYPSVVSKDGTLVATLLHEDKLGIDLTSTMSAVQSAAKHFSSILQLTGCPHLLISGDTQVFSLYSLYGDYILVFFKSKQSTDDTLDRISDEANAKVRQIIQELNTIIRTALEEVES